MHHQLLLIFVLLPGIVGMIGFGYYALVDWQSLQQAYQYFATVTLRE